MKEGRRGIIPLGSFLLPRVFEGLLCWNCVNSLRCGRTSTETYTQEDDAAVSYKLAVIRFRGDSLNKTYLINSLSTAISVIESVHVEKA